MSSADLAMVLEPNVEDVDSHSNLLSLVQSPVSPIQMLSPVRQQSKALVRKIMEHHQSLK